MRFKRIKDLREDHDLLQKDIANLLGISQQYYSEYEKGNRTISADMLKNICIFLNVSADELLGLEIKNSYYSLNKENTQIINKIKKALLLSQKRN